MISSKIRIRFLKLPPYLSVLLLVYGDKNSLIRYPCAAWISTDRFCRCCLRLFRTCHCRTVFNSTNRRSILLCNGLPAYDFCLFLLLKYPVPLSYFLAGAWQGYGSDDRRDPRTDRTACCHSAFCKRLWLSGRLPCQPGCLDLSRYSKYGCLSVMEAQDQESSLNLRPVYLSA